eukprot:GHVU01065519.1.p1 GENE.GHVU01065519.1~~GHVU01065519.1.p1  ORF type:complete len:322 (-),score=24.45 GHVU01065519.1:80-949(-)
MGKTWTAREQWGAESLPDPAPIPLEEWQMPVWAEFRKALDDLHSYRTIWKKKYLLKLRTPKDQRTRLHAGIEKGAYVLIALPVAKHGGGPKLQLRWTGPHRVVAVHSHWIYEIESLISLERRKVHASRIRIYCDASRGREADLQDAAYEYQDLWPVQDILDHRYNGQRRRHELLVWWEGFEKEEATWSSLTTVSQDATDMVSDFLVAHKGAITPKGVIAIEKALKAVRAVPVPPAVAVGTVEMPKKKEEKKRGGQCGAIFGPPSPRLSKERLPPLYWGGDYDSEAAPLE